MPYIPIREFAHIYAKGDKKVFKETVNKLYGRIATGKMEKEKDYILSEVVKKSLIKKVNEDYKV